VNTVNLWRVFLSIAASRATRQKRQQRFNSELRSEQDVLKFVTHLKSD